MSVSNLGNFPHTIGNLDDRPNLTANQMKAKLEQDVMTLWAKLVEVVPYVNDIIPLSRLVDVVNHSSTDSGVPTAKAVYDAIADASLGGNAQQIIDDWLDDHPAATTTVQDGSITNAKLANTFETPGLPAVYSSSNTYNKGDYVFYNKQLYRCTTDITTAEIWTSGHWTQFALTDDVKGNKNSSLSLWKIMAGNSLNADLAKVCGRRRSFNGVTFSADNGVVSVSGTSLGVSTFDLVAYKEVPANFPLIAGKTYSLAFQQSDNTSLYIQIQYKAVGSNNWTSIYSANTQTDSVIFTVPQSFDDFVVRFTCDSAGRTYSKTVSVSIVNIDMNGLDPFDDAVIDGIKTGRFPYNLFFQRKGSTVNSFYGVKVVNDGENISLSGTGSGTAAYYLIEDYNNTIFKPGDKISITYKDPAGNVYIECVTKDGATTHSPMLQTVTSGTYVLTFPQTFDYCRINLLIISGTTYSTTVSVKVESVSDSPRTIIVAKDGTGDYSNLKDAIEDAIKSYGTKVIVKPGTYDLVSEYTTAYLDTLSSGDYGLMLGNGVQLNFAPTAYVTFDYDGDNPWIIGNFSPFNTMNSLGFTIDGLHCVARNCRYILHDDPRPEAKTNYSYNVIKNCYFELYSSPTYPSWVNHQIIGGGLGDSTEVVIENCIFNDHFTGVTKYNAVSYHNSTSGSADYESRITVKDSYFANGNTLSFEGYGAATSKTKIIVTNNSLQNGSADIAYSGSTADNMVLYAWNNASRS